MYLLIYFLLFVQKNSYLLVYFLLCTKVSKEPKVHTCLKHVT